MCAKQFISITAMFFLMNMMSAQDNLIASTSSTTSPTDFFNDFTSLDSDMRSSSEADEDVYFDVPEQVSHFDWKTQTFEIAEGKVKYSKAEVLDENTNETVKTVKLEKSNGTVDMSDVPSGAYYLILTSDNGQVHSEKILIL